MNLKIAHLKLDNPFVLAPLAGYTDLAFRRLCREYGAGLCYSEMISCHGLVYQQKNTLEMLESCPEERPVVMQLFGAEPEVMGEAAGMLADYPIDLIDINMGCPVKKVIKKGAGCALMKEPQLAARIIRAVADNSKHPVTVKIRTGWNHHAINGPEFAAMAEQAGASAIAVHARTWTDGFSGPVDYRVISRIKEKVSIPVIGNGDIHTHEAGIKLMAETGCDGVMIGRSALGAPWIFSPNVNPEPSLQFRLKALKRHLELVELHHPVESILAKIKNHAGKYFKGVIHGSSMRRQIYDCKSFAELKQITLAALAAEA